jgi:hypothetical protein
MPSKAKVKVRKEVVRHSSGLYGDQEIWITTCTRCGDVGHNWSPVSARDLGTAHMRLHEPSGWVRR